MGIYGSICSSRHGSWLRQRERDREGDMTREVEREREQQEETRGWRETQTDRKTE